VVACAGKQGDSSWGVGFVGAEVEEDSDGKDGDEAGEVDV